MLLPVIMINSLAVAEDEEFAKEFKSMFGTNQRYTDSVLTQVYLAFNEVVLGAAFDEESGVLGFNVTNLSKISNKNYTVNENVKKDYSAVPKETLKLIEEAEKLKNN